MQIFIGYDPNEVRAYDVFEYSLRRRSSSPLDIRPVKLDACRNAGLFWRKFDVSNGKIFDLISQAPCATEFSITRFITPHLASEPWALFVDCDMLARADIAGLFELADPKYAVMVTKHVHLVTDGSAKMDGQIQTSYSRKNWSSCMLFNVNHPSNRALTVDMVNSVPGRDLHNFRWLKDEEIGELPLSWNHLAGYALPVSGDGMIYPQYDYAHIHNVHFTEGMPFMAGYENCPFAEEWRAEERSMNEAR